ncbi:hypothetical protein C8Q76DRAFT_229827 [Earliella scabrosa]|nr:hypothetical protein C8Q76DRAFT_229827 [Earliella scabrosa]
MQAKGHKDRVRSLALKWPECKLTDGATARNLRILMEYILSSDLQYLEIFPNGPRESATESIVIPNSVRTLNTTLGFLICLADPLPPIRHLSIRVQESDWRSIHAEIAPFNETLVTLRLRLVRTSPFLQKHDSPVRLCARLGTRRLEYLEILEEQGPSSRPRYPPGHCDKTAGTRFHVDAYANMQRLRTLVWMPTWSQGADEDVLPGGQYHETVAQFQEDLLHVLGLQLFILVLPGDRCMRFSPSGKGLYCITPMTGFGEWWRSARVHEEWIRGTSSG